MNTARKRALRAASVVALAGALAGCSRQHFEGNALDTSVIDSASSRDTTMDPNVINDVTTDVVFADTRDTTDAPDTSDAMTCAPLPPDCAAPCTGVAEECCSDSNGNWAWNPELGACCPTCAVGPLTPPALFV